ncbi:tetratricopeptide repeat protein [Achromobacter spanius]|uniref:tetratricopeptide repeat protein n=1 Tax=Achromobacter spanius TaxID=217203 RepID=UPI00320B47A0
MDGGTKIRSRAARCGLAASVLVIGAGLSGCQTNKTESAWQLIQQQQQEQALMRQQEDEAENRSRPKEPEMMLSLIVEAQRQERYFASLAYIDGFEQKFGKDPRVAVLRAEALRQTGQSALSEQAYRALTATDQAAEGWHGLGLIAGSRGQFDQAADYLARAARLSPMDARILGDLGYARLRAGDPAGARVPLGQAAELTPESGKVLANLAVLLLVQGDALRAQQVMDRAQLGEDARGQVLRLAAQIRGQLAPVAAQASAARAPGGEQVVLPMMSPLMEGLGNGPIVR